MRKRWTSSLRRYNHTRPSSQRRCARSLLACVVGPAPLPPQAPRPRAECLEPFGAFELNSRVAGMVASVARRTPTSTCSPAALPIRTGSSLARCRPVSHLEVRSPDVTCTKLCLTLDGHEAARPSRGGPAACCQKDGLASVSLHAASRALRVAAQQVCALATTSCMYILLVAAVL